MTPRAWTAALLLAAAVPACGMAARPPAEATVAGPRTASAQGPARLCLRPDAATLQGLRRGEHQLVVVVTAFRPPRGIDASLVAWLASGNRRAEIGRFAIHPLRAFSAAEPRRSQRFAFRLEPAAALLVDGEPLCVEVGFGDGRNQAHEGTADIGIELEERPR